MRRRSAMRRMIGTMLALVLTTCLPARSDAQPATTAQESPVTPAPRWEVSLEGRVGLPTGYIRVSETVTHGTRLRLSDLGLDVSETVEAGVAVWLTPRDSGRGTSLFYVLARNTPLDPAVLYGGREYSPRPAHTNADFRL